MICAAPAPAIFAAWECPRESSCASADGRPGTDFIQKNNCGTSLAPGAGCTSTLGFKPHARGTRTAAISIVDNAPGSPHMITLSGNGTVLSVAPASLSFGNQKVGTTSSPQTVTVTNNGPQPIQILGISIKGSQGGDFADTTTCGSSLAAMSSCTVGVTFTPTKTGFRSVTLSVAGGGGSPQTASLSGTGT